MPSQGYEQYPVEVRMGQHGYWIVTISASPWQRYSIMIVEQGISPDRARELALGASSLLAPG